MRTVIPGSPSDPVFTAGEASSTLIQINLGGWPKGADGSETA
jgi:hypothetical protein